MTFSLSVFKYKDSQLAGISLLVCLYFKFLSDLKGLKSGLTSMDGVSPDDFPLNVYGVSKVESRLKSSIGATLY